MEHALLNEKEFRRFKSKDRHVFKTIFDRYFDLLQFVARRCGAKPHNCDDIVQEVFIRLYKHSDQIYDQEHIKNWLVTTTRNLCMDQARQHAVENRYVQQQTSEKESDASQTSANFATNSEIHELELILVGELIDKITTETNDETFALFYRDGLSAKEIASRQNAPVSTITNRISRTRRRFRTYFETHIKQLHEELL